MTTTANVPNTPVGLTAVASSTTQINLAWTNLLADQTGFKIEQSPDGSAFNQIGTASGSATSYSVYPLTAGSTYYFRILAYNGVGNSAYSNVATASTLAAPSAPSGLVATVISNTQVNLAWTDNSQNEQGFRVERSTDGTNFNWSITTSANDTSYVASSLTPGTQYWFRVKAYNGSTDSAPSQAVSVTTTASVPNTPVGLTAVATSTTQINVAWTNLTADQTGFKIEQSPDGSAFNQIGTASGSATSYSVYALTAGSTYYFRVRAYNTVGDSAYSNVATASTLGPPAAPSNLSAAVVSGTQVNLTWTDNSQNEQGFRVERSSDGISFNWTVAVSANATSYVTSSLTPGTQYWFRVKAYSGSSDSVPSQVVSATTAAEALTAPVGLTAVATSTTQINLAWTNLVTDQTGFKIEQSTDASAFNQIGSLSSGGYTSYSVSSLMAGSTYYFRVRAYNSVGDSTYSNAATASTLAAPGAPSGLVATVVSNTQVDLAWQDNSQYEQGFRVEQSTDGTTFSQIATTSANVTRRLMTGLTAGSPYWFRVKAYSGSSDSLPSQVVSVMTTAALPHIPGSLIVSSATASSVTLAWIDSATNQDGYKIEQSVDGANFSQTGTASASASSYIVSPLAPNTSLYFRICAYNTAGNSAYTAAVYGTSLLPTPTNPTASVVSTTQVNLTWTAVAGATGYRVYRSFDGSTWDTTPIGTSETLAFSDISAWEGGRNYYRIIAFNANTISANSGWAYADTPPAPPTGLLVSAISATQVDLAWTDHSDGETGFVIQQSLTGTDGWTQVATVGSNVANYWAHGPFNPATTYYFRVGAMTAAYPASNASYASGDIGSFNLSDAPTGLMASVISGTQIDLSWTASANADSYRVELREGVSGNWTVAGTVSSSQTNFAATGLTAGGTGYSFRVAAVTAPGMAVYSNTASAETPNPRPDSCHCSLRGCQSGDHDEHDSQCSRRRRRWRDRADLHLVHHRLALRRQHQLQSQFQQCREEHDSHFRRGW